MLCFKLILSSFSSNQSLCFFWFSEYVRAGYVDLILEIIPRSIKVGFVKGIRKLLMDTKLFHFLHIHAFWYFNSGHMYFPSDVQFKLSLDQLTVCITLSTAQNTDTADIFQITASGNDMVDHVSVF